eukprot:scaffold2809_cov373-Prasinococcus_capsulatus_cf.AAC.7
MAKEARRGKQCATPHGNTRSEQSAVPRARTFGPASLGSSCPSSRPLCRRRPPPCSSGANHRYALAVVCCGPSSGDVRSIASLPAVRRGREAPQRLRAHHEGVVTKETRPPRRRRGGGCTIA